MEKISNYIIPLIILIIIIYGIKKKINVYDSFINGAKEGISLSLSIFPSLIAIIFAVDVFSASSFITDFFSIFKHFLSYLHIPVEILPLALTRPISGNASYAIMIDIIKKYGADSYLGNLAAIMQGSTDTTLYVLSIYFSSIGIKNIKYAMKAGLLADLVAFICSILVISFIF